MTLPDNAIDELPPDLAERLHRLAEFQTRGSQPWPGVERAMQRSRRRRVAGLSTLASAGVLVAGTTLGSNLVAPAAITPRPTPSASFSSATPGPVGTPDAPEPRTPEEAGFTGPVGGSLGSDHAWQAGLRQQMIAETSDRQGTTIASAKNVLVLWAGDLNGGRYAVVAYQISRAGPTDSAGWATGALSGPAGAEPTKMTLQARNVSHVLPTTSSALFIRAVNQNAQNVGLIFVTAPKATAATVARTRRFFPDGHYATTWRPLQKQGGAVWVSRLNRTELTIADYQTAGMAQGLITPGSAADLEAADAAIAQPGTDLAALKGATDELKYLGISDHEHPVLATGVEVSAGSGPYASQATTVAATVWRSPDGGYLFSIAQRWPKIGRLEVTAGVAVNEPANVSPGGFMTATTIDESSATASYTHFLVIAPEGATTVRISNQTATVHNRLAVLDVPFSLSDRSNTRPEIQALDMNGKIIARNRTYDQGPSATD